MPKRKKKSYEQRLSNNKKRKLENRSNSVQSCDKENVQECTEDESEGKQSTRKQSKLEKERIRYKNEDVRASKLSTLRERRLNPVTKEQERQQQRDHYQESEVHEEKLSWFQYLKFQLFFQPFWLPASNILLTHFEYFPNSLRIFS